MGKWENGAEAKNGEKEETRRAGKEENGENKKVETRERRRKKRGSFPSRSRDGRGTFPSMVSVTPGVRKLVLLVGTVKGFFRYESDASRSHWDLSGPHLGGWEIFSVCGDPRSSRIVAGIGHFMHGPTVRTSTDGGATWEPVARDPRFPDGSTFKLNHIWHLGATSGELFFSRDAGETWERLPGQLPRITTLKTWWIP